MAQKTHKLTIEQRKKLQKAMIGNRNAFRGGTEDLGFFMDKALLRNLKQVRHALNDNDDVEHIVVGQEGSGKSVFAMQLCYAVDRTFNMDRVCFSLQELTNAIYKAEPRQAILLDESFELSWRNGMTKLQRTMMGVMQQMRQKCLYLVLVIPDFKELDSYTALHRSGALFKVYKKNIRDRIDPTIRIPKRGYWKSWGRNQKNQIYEELKKKNTRRSDVRCNTKGTFPNWYVVNKEQYMKKKQQSFEKFLKQAKITIGGDKKDEKKKEKK